MNKTVLITGANRGVGLALTVAYLEAGWRVYATCRDIARANELTQRQSLFPNLTIVELDVTNHDAILHLAQSMASISLDLLINNAGYYGPKGYGFGNTDAEEWRKVLEINTIAPLKLAEAFYPQLKEGTPGMIACVSSKVGSMAENTSGGGYIYRSSKAALNSVVKSLSNDLQAEGIITIALHPGWVQTEMGGPNALIDSQTSAVGLKKVIDNLTPADSGLFMDYQGNYLPW
ncbi:short-chain dehydrogenase [Photobacterium gaetbulicola]|uniref:Putative oxidoreductase protein n=1 Tax=Photobacterium gaetbulicola Gung47 TaxID=658445 RepID=A0A0C5WSI4_9GAMM|nr:SDR family oxidoreductase [Photobacterium gaetbulicola]AJR08039.1 putative oxidoreductase protein [Photobacterium gaetbulicola Gung47]PSU07741.1 short-chain dehydrogenase [Photobacterium gaetbulicola]